MAPIGNPKKDSATEGEAAQRRSGIKKGDLVAIALVCESARHFNKLEKLLIGSTVQQLPGLAALAGEKRCSKLLFTKGPVSEATQGKAKARDDLTLVTAGEMFEAR